jgi:signal transduction histidine kinase
MSLMIKTMMSQKSHIKIANIAPSKSSSVALALLFTLLLSISLLTLLFFMNLASNHAQVISDQASIAYDSHFIKWLGWGVSILLFLLAVGGFYIADRVVYRINIIANTANNIINTGDLSRRIPYFGSWDDLSKLADILNQLFARIEHLMDEVRQVSDMIAHDLRTPLTRLKNRLEMLNQKSEQQQLGIEDDVDSLLAEADHLLETFAALLRIRTVESGKWHCANATLELSELIHDVTEYYEPLVLEKNQHLHVDLQPTRIVGDRHLLFQAFANMIDNAVKYAPTGGSINIRLTCQESGCIFIIENSGNHVAEEHLERIFQRFYRTDSARTSHQGNGLGLSLVKAIIKSHHGEITAYNTENGFGLKIIFLNM